MPVLIVLLLVSVFAGAVLSVLRIPPDAPAWIAWLRPLWLHLLVAFWVLAGGGRFGIVTGWWIGLLGDVLQGAPLGMHAATGALVAYVCVRTGPLLRQMPVIQQAFMLVPLFLLVAALHALVLLLAQGSGPGFTWLLSGLTSALVWPLLVLLLGGGRSLVVERSP